MLNATTLLVEGILWGGEFPDFVFDDDGNCLRSRVCPDEGCLGELVTRTTLFAELVAASPSPTIYEVYLGRCDDVVPPLDLELLGETGEKEWTVQGLEPGAIYCWQIVAKRECGESEGPLWTFTTRVPEFVRGDVNDDGSTNVTDAVNVLNFLFSGNADSPPCDAAADINDDGTINVTDPVALLNFLFSDGAVVPPPTDECGVDPTPDLTCEMFEQCE